MDWHAAAGILSGILAVSTLVPYLPSIIWGTTRPSTISQSLWCLFALLAVVGQYAAGGWSYSMAVALGTAFNNVVIVAVCLFGYGYKGHTRFDIVSGLLAVFGIVVWQITDIPEYAVMFAIIASIFAGIPTYRKTLRHPESENTLSWMLVFGSAFFSLVALSGIAFASVAFPLFVLLEAVLVISLSMRKASSGAL